MEGQVVVGHTCALSLVLQIETAVPAKRGIQFSARTCSFEKEEF